MDPTEQRRRDGAPAANDGAAEARIEPAPDHAEEELAELIDDAVPTRGYAMLPMVGLGGSAGGIAGAAALFRGDAGRHRHGLRRRHAPVARAREHARPRSCSARPRCRCCRSPTGSASRPTHVYVIPPGKTIAVGERPPDLRRHDARARPARRRRPVLPHPRRHPRPARDGDRPVRRRRRRRDRHQAHQGARRPDHRAGSRTRPSTRACRARRSRTGMVDWVLPVAEMAARLDRYVPAARARLSCRPKKRPRRPRQPTSRRRRREAVLREVLAYLRAQTGRDFSYYKRATILRRIGRRMQVNGIERAARLPGLPAHPSGRGRRAAAGPAHQRHQLLPRPRSLRSAGGADPRAVHGQGPRRRGAGLGRRPAPPARRPTRSRCCWPSMRARSRRRRRCRSSPPTSTRRRSGSPARASIRRRSRPTCPRSGCAAIFIKEHRGYRVRRELRETVLFAIHDLLKDSPFSRLDLFSCRNLFIYLNREAQTRAFEIVHFALRPGAPVPRHLGDGRRLGAAVRAGRQEASHLRAASAGRQRMPVPAGHGTLRARACAAGAGRAKAIRCRPGSACRSARC